jgi:hypothetical protein
MREITSRDVEKETQTENLIDDLLRNEENITLFS